VTRKSPRGYLHIVSNSICEIQTLKADVTLQNLHDKAKHDKVIKSLPKVHAMEIGSFSLLPLQRI